MRRNKPSHHLMTSNHRLDPFSISLWCDGRKNTIGRNPTGSSTEDIDSVDSEEERFPMFIWLLNDFCRTNADFLRDMMELGPFIC